MDENDEFEDVPVGSTEVEEMAGENIDESRKRQQRLIKIVTVIIVIVIILGLVAHLILVYMAASALEITDERFDKLEKRSATSYEITFTLTLENPTSTAIEIEEITYNVYLEGQFLGSGNKRSFSIEPGTRNYKFEFQFKLDDLLESVLQSFLYSSATLKITGDVKVPAKFFGAWKFAEITVPYEILEEINSRFTRGIADPELKNNQLYLVQNKIYSELPDEFMIKAHISEPLYI